MTASSGPGISLMSEGFSYLAGAELPCVVADISRGGPGLGNIAPEQSDYFQTVKGGGHGNYHSFVLAPASVQEMADLTRVAFEMADEYRNPVIILADGVIGQMMEPVEFPAGIREPHTPDWAVDGTPATIKNLITSLYISPDDLEAHNHKLLMKYRRAEREDTRWENVQTEDAGIVFVGYGIVARILKHVVEKLRAEGVRAGLLRPITLYPFPSLELARLAETASRFVAVEMSTGQMVEDVRLAVNGRRPVEFYGRWGGNLPEVPDIIQFAGQWLSQEAPVHA
jgi:pyruvate/2-oxoacid:ferredoxin oxidoreductase alpha subunit